MTYRNTCDHALWLPGLGIVKAGGEINTSTPLNNANFVKVETKTEKKEEPKSPEIKA